MLQQIEKIFGEKYEILPVPERIPTEKLKQNQMLVRFETKHFYLLTKKNNEK